MAAAASTRVTSQSVVPGFWFSRTISLTGALAGAFCAPASPAVAAHNPTAAKEQSGVDSRRHGEARVSVRESQLAEGRGDGQAGRLQRRQQGAEEGHDQRVGQALGSSHGVTANAKATWLKVWKFMVDVW